MNTSNKFKEVLGCKYPIVAMAMNQVSDINLAKAVRIAGGIPSLSIYTYPKDNKISKLEQDLNEYKSIFNDLKIFVSIGVNELIIPELLKLIVDLNVEFVELINDGREEFDYDEDKNIKKVEAMKVLTANNIKIFTKCLSPIDIIPNIDGIIIKGIDGAGRGFYNTLKLFNHIHKKYPELDIIVSGGVGTAKQVQYYMENGALAIGVGTLLAASEESVVSTETKLKLVDATSNDLTRFSVGAKQNSIVFEEVEDTDYNHTKGLKLAIKNPQAGHIFAGTSIDNVTAIKPVAVIIKELTANLNL